MAIWQYRLSVIPKNSILDRYGEIPAKLFIDEEAWKAYWKERIERKTDIEPGFEDARTINWWKNINVNAKEISSQIDRLVKRGDWSNNMDYFGWKGDTNSNEDNDCHIAINNVTNEIQEFEFRTDLRANENIVGFLKGMIEICEANAFLVMNSNGSLFEPNFELVYNDLAESNAVKFLTDPEKFIQEFHEKNDRKSKRENFWTKLKKILK
jgi:hypothetical protein